jgi:Mrp family chromosome partitioning ATPase
VIADTADEFDLIVIDDGLSSTESVLLGSPRFLDNVIMVVESGHTRRDQLQEGLEALNQTEPGQAHRRRSGRVACVVR